MGDPARNAVHKEENMSIVVPVYLTPVYMASEEPVAVLGNRPYWPYACLRESEILRTLTGHADLQLKPVPWDGDLLSLPDEPGLVRVAAIPVMPALLPVAKFLESRGHVGYYRDSVLARVGEQAFWVADRTKPLLPPGHWHQHEDDLQFKHLPGTTATQLVNHFLARMRAKAAETVPAATEELVTA